MSEIVARICKDLGLEPDWNKLAEELWAKAEIATGDPGWPLAGRARAPEPVPEPVPEPAIEPALAGGGWDGRLNTS